MRFPTSLCFVVVVSFAVAQPGLRADDAKDDLKLFQGDWKVVGLEADGKQAPAEAIKGVRMKIKGSVFEGTYPGQTSGEKATVKLDSSKSPKQIDLVVLEGPEKGKTVEGIYKLEKDRLVLCMRGPEVAEKGRPKEFKTDTDSGLGMMTLERIKE
ncbi:MAG TPA: TIGR03067 domain-containing protein [Gemmataceae bacterium]|jgi:uncharacterized protein (TIGR03067 family)|nr:TIGR03067 domain-containing protein [Gemmataceae bacterium]